MADANLVDFVKAALERGQSRASIKDALKTAGWPDDQVDSALGAFAEIAFPVPVPRPRNYGSAREAFLYIVYFSLLGMVAAQTGTLAFAWIDRLFEDTLSNTATYASYATTGLRWSVASLLVGYPIFVFLGWRLAAKKRQDVERRRSRVHAWLTYVTLIFAAGALIGDLVAIVYQFLNGELQTRFMAKALVVGAISASILWNYSRDVERRSSRVDIGGRILAIVTTLVVGALVAWAFTIVRSPQTARLQAADEQRINDLIQITRLIDCHYTYSGALPESLDAAGVYLSDRAQRLPVADGCSYSMPAEPAGGVYDYRVIDSDTYEICASFDFGWPDADNQTRDWRPGGYFSYPTALKRRNLQRPAGPGQSCFEIVAVNFETAAPGQAEE